MPDIPLAVDRRDAADRIATSSRLLTLSPAWHLTGQPSSRRSISARACGVLVSGRIQTGSYVNRDGQKVYTTEVILDDQEFADSKGQASDMGGYGQSAPAQRPASCQRDW